ncbi:hypothetical protein [Pseudonocardia spinosispora]|uniref:hypothetical protein n=1 Tax=Pseudonocardia spinosispora TaxID=103441 RepID=UPI0003FF420B|nr:hypothetical protein [Pseudonocardia spinosispora]
MDNESSRNCPSCGWPEAEVYELISRDGSAMHTRCPCGREQELEAPRTHRARDTATVLAGIVLVPATAAMLPLAAVLACLGLAAVIGGMAWAWAWLNGTTGWDGLLGYALRAGMFGGAAGLALAGLALVFGPATVVLIPTLYVLAATLYWLGHAPSPAPC